MILLGLTGSIGMGKSTTAQMFRDAGVPVHDADAVVHALYAGEAAPLIEAAFPGSTTDGVVDRGKLSAQVVGKPEAMTRLERIVHPLVARERDRFLAQAEQQGARVAVLDIPLLFETGNERLCDAIVVVTADADTQRARVLSRPGMDERKFAALLARQVPDAQKRAAADFVVETGHGLDPARAQVSEILARAVTLPRRRP